MSWNDIVFIAHRFLFSTVSATVAGSVLILLICVLERITAWRNSCLHLVWLKMANLFYLIPIASVLVMVLRMDFNGKRIAWTSPFGMVLTPPMEITYMVAAGIWCVGLLAGCVVRMVEYRRLTSVLRGNVPVEDDKCIELFKQYKEKYQLRRVSIYQNDLVEVPITVGVLRPQIILPYKSYTEKELHMILRHEMNHIKAGDLLWKRINLLVTFIHWWNPFSYILLKKLVLRQEIASDIKTCEGNEHFSMKEYGDYLAGLEMTQKDRVFLSSLGSCKKDIEWRIEALARGKKHKKWVEIASCTIFSILSFVPSYAAAEGIASANEAWIEATEVAVKEELIDWSVFEDTGVVTEDVVEVDLTINGIQTLSQLVELDMTINPKHRVLYQWQDMEVGDVISVVVNCADKFPVYHIGIRDVEGNLTYVEGSGKLNHMFVITTAGRYTVYVENRSNVAIDIAGSAMYPD